MIIPPGMGPNGPLPAFPGAPAVTRLSDRTAR